MSPGRILKHTKIMNISKTSNLWLKEIILTVVLLYVIFGFNTLVLALEPFLGQQKKSVEWSPLYELVIQYCFIVGISSLVSFLIAFILGSLIVLFQWKDIKRLCIALGSLGTTFPTIAVIALLVPLLGYGYKPVIIALIFYGIFPILLNTIDGIEHIDPQMNETANALGMTPFQQLHMIQLPLAFPLIVAGMRTSFIITIASATVGSVVGAGGLGIPIISGIRTNDPILILKGAGPVVLIALLVDSILVRLEKRPKWRN